MRFFFHIAFHGYNYRGWQSQKRGVSIQEAIQNALSTLFQEKIIIHGCGRTDAQVSATQYFFHTTIKNYFDNNTLFRINSLLPKDIVVLDIIPVDKRSQAQFHAQSRTYEYLIHGTKNPFLEKYSTFFLIEKLNLAAIGNAINLLHIYNDYKAFCKTPDKHDSTICKISEAKLFYNESENRLKIKISSDHFLRNMIRILVKKLIEIGEGKLSIQKFEDALNNNTPFTTIKMAPAKGLYLTKVCYPTIELPNKFDDLNAINWKMI